MNCPNCQTENPDGAKFCHECGTRLAFPPNSLTPDALAREHSLPRPPIPDPRSLMPQAFVTKLDHARHSQAMVGERRIVTMLFCDVKGSTAAAGQLDPEEWAAIMNGVFESMIRPVYKYEGTVARLMGDAILAFFGAPIAHEDDPQRAILAGLDIIAGFQPYKEKVERTWGVALAVRVGINTGLVMVGQVGSNLQMEYTAMGDAINVAARMEQTAVPDTVQVSAETYRLVAPLFEWEDLGEVEVKGKDKPTHTYRPLRPQARPGRLRGLEAHGISSPLVGRAVEFKQLRHTVAQLQAGQGNVALLLGEAGVGKSRLVAELRQFAVPNPQPPAPITWLEGRTLSFGQTIAYWPFQEILRAYAGLREDDTETVAWTKLKGRLTGLFGAQAPEIIPYLATLLALPIRDEYAERVRYLDAEALGRQVFLASRRFLARLARATPLVLVFEDIHWMDDASTRLLEHLIPLVQRVPLVIIGVSRPDLPATGAAATTTPLARVQAAAQQALASRYLEINLTPLSAQDSRQLIGNLLQIEELPAHVRTLIVQKSDGNPFFLEEVLRTLISTGAVTRNPETGRWRATEDITSIYIPDTIQGVIMARVDRLDEDVKRLLRTAAVIGRSFLYRVLRAVAAADAQMDQDLAELQAVELIREKQRDPELEYIFKHALAQEAAYENTLLQTRRQLHARVGGAIEQLFADRLDEFYGLLAYHFARAEQWDKAQAYLFQAGDQAARMAADAEALAHYRQALAAYERAFGDQWDPVQRAALERKMGEALFRRGEHEQAREHLLRALNLLGAPFPSDLAGVRAAALREVLRQVDNRLLPRLFLRGKRPLAAMPAVNEELDVYDALVWIEVVSSPERFMLASLRALNLAERVGNLKWMSLGFSGLQVVLDFFGQYRLGGFYGRLSLATARQCDDPAALGLSHQILCMHASWTGNGAEAILYGEQSAGYHRRAGDLRGWGAATMLAAETELYLGAFDSARERAAQLLQDGEDGGDPQVQAWGYSILGPAQLYSGQLPEAIASLERYLAIAESIADVISMMEATTQLALCHIMEGNLEEALAAIARSERLRAEHNIIGRRFVGRLHNVRAEAYLLAAEQADGEKSQEWLRQASHACRAARRFNRAYRPWLSCSYRLQGRYEWLHSKPGAAGKWWRRSLKQAEALGQRYEATLTQQEMGQWAGTPAHLT